MFTAMYDFRDEYGNRAHANAKIGGYKSRAAAVRAILRKSPFKSGTILIGQAVQAVIKNGHVLSLPS